MRSELVAAVSGMRHISGGESVVSLVSGIRNVKDFGANQVTKLRWSVWVPLPAGNGGGLFRQTDKSYSSSDHTDHLAPKMARKAI
ncbi:hypothetical protein AND_009050 [Anopheles darlingi]|uniref:Uncharacterized protein n=1 Tax=Anopheles darlingi TaxID=43151 RepID=W5J995_ANODA|nr:hypothetical protein AND_009050 [Anopheles darlingi]